MSDNIFDEVYKLAVEGPTDREREIIESVVARGAQRNVICPPPAEHIITVAPERQLTFLDIAQYENDAQNVDIGEANFTQLQPTTFGLSGTFSHVSFNEEQIISKIQLKYPCIRAICNFGDIRAPEFARLIETGAIDTFSDEKSARARAKHQQRAGAHIRKVQGTGVCFNSSILFWIYSEQFRVVYKLRLFRTGQFGLPGTKPHMIRDILAVCESSLAPILREVFARNDIVIVSLAPIMKNYKWQRILARDEHLNLRAIAHLIAADANPPLPIGYVDNGCYNDNKLSVKFNASLAKTIRANIFSSGKINILGAFETEITKKICVYLVAILARPEMIIAKSSELTQEQLCALRVRDFPDISSSDTDTE